MVMGADSYKLPPRRTSANLAGLSSVSTLEAPGFVQGLLTGKMLPILAVLLMWV